jgi:hypothetical protein
MPREKGRIRRVGSAHHLDEVVIMMHRQVVIEDNVRRDTPKRRLDVLLDLLVIKLPRHEHGPLEGRVRHHLV